MQVRCVLVQPDYRERISDELPAVKRAEHLTCCKRGHHKHRCRLHLQVGLAPNLALQLDASVKFFQLRALSNDDAFAHGLFSAARATVFCSLRFAASHSASISGLGIFSSVW